MDSIKTGMLITKSRRKKRMTQRELADRLNVSDKAISKWERGQGCPDIASINDLAEVLGVNVTEILSGESKVNDNDSGNMKKTRFYVCPNCGNIIASTGDMIINCCGCKLTKLKAAKEADAEHVPTVEFIDGEMYISAAHEMDKKHYVSFIAYVTSNMLSVIKLYPEQGAEARFHMTGHGIVYVFCNQHGLWMKNI